MASKTQSKLTGTAEGSGYTTRSLDAESQSRRIVWENGEAWRLRKLRVGNDPWALPGKEELFTAKTIQSNRDANRAVIVIGSQHSGLSSFRNWLADEKAGVRMLPVDLADAQLAGTESDARLKAIARSLLRAGKRVDLKLEEQADPIEALRAIASTAKESGIDAAVFSGLASLDDETATRFFGRLRGLYEDPDGPLKDIGLVLLGRSIRPLDPEEAKPVSTLLSVSTVWTTTTLYRCEISELSKVGKKDLPQGALGELFSWAGGEPVLVQAILQLLHSKDQPRISSVDQAIEFLERERLPAFETWKRTLRKSLRESEMDTDRLVHRLLRFGSIPNSQRIRRITLLDLLVEGWVRPNWESDNEASPIPDQWVFQSECREMLAREAYSER